MALIMAEMAKRPTVVVQIAGTATTVRSPSKWVKMVVFIVSIMLIAKRRDKLIVMTQEGVRMGMFSVIKMASMRAIIMVERELRARIVKLIGIAMRVKSTGNEMRKAMLMAGMPSMRVRIAKVAKTTAKKLGMTMSETSFRTAMAPSVLTRAVKIAVITRQASDMAVATTAPLMAIMVDGMGMSDRIDKIECN